MARRIPQPLYAVAMQQAAEGSDLDEMMALADQAEAHVASEGDIGAALDELKATIAQAQGGGGTPVPPYGVAIQQSIAGGDPEEMRKTADAAEAHLAEVSAALDKLRAEIDARG